MNAKYSNSRPLFQDRPLGAETARRAHDTAYSIYRQEHGDSVEAALRVFLMLCLFASLAIFSTSVISPDKAAPAARAISTHAAPSADLGHVVRAIEAACVLRP